MADVFDNFLDMESNAELGKDFWFEMRRRSRDLVLLAIHGGGIERGTTELLRGMAAEWNDSYYLFEGRNFDYHLTSHKFDEPHALELVKKHDYALSVHGYKDDQEACTIVGGLHESLEKNIISALNDAGFKAVAATDRFTATNPDNICNRCATGLGVQLELSTLQRKNFFEGQDWHSGKMSGEFYDYITAIGEGLTDL